MIGRTIGTYRMIQRVGVGGVGEVFVGEDLMLERPVAIKVLRPELASRPDIVARFRTEAVTLAKVNHTHIATVYAFLQEEADFFLIMEYVRGWTLQCLIEMHQILAPAVAVRLLRQALDGIGFAHRHSVIHRDIKPANLMLADNGLIKVMDFGLARVLGTAHVTRFDRFVGTLAYISPEQLCGEEADVRSDIYSLGIVLYELVTGHVPFEHHSEYNLIRAQVEAAPPSPRTFTQTLSEDLEGIILKALSKAPDDRFQSAEAFSLALEQCVTEADDASVLSVCLPVRQLPGPPEAVPQGKGQAIWVNTPSRMVGADDQATRLAETYRLSDMTPAVTWPGPKPRKYRLLILTSGLLLAASSIFVVDVSNIPIRRGQHAEKAETSAVLPQSAPVVVSADAEALATGHSPVAAEYREPETLRLVPFADVWVSIQPDRFCKAPDDDDLTAMLAMTSEAPATGLHPTPAQRDNAAPRVSASMADTIPPLSVTSSYAAPAQNVKKRKIDEKTPQRGSGWIIRR